MPSTVAITASLQVRNIAARTDTAGTAITDYSGEEDRFPHIVYSQGYLTPVLAFRVVAQGGNMNVLVGSGSAKVDYYVVRGLIAGQGNYIVRHESATTTVTLDAADPAQGRKDEIYLVVQDNPYDGSSRGTPRLYLRKGDLGGALPGPDAIWDAYALLATVTVNAGASSITSGNIADNRVAATLTVPSLSVTNIATNTAGWPTPRLDRVVFSIPDFIPFTTVIPTLVTSNVKTITLPTAFGAQNLRVTAIAMCSYLQEPAIPPQEIWFQTLINGVGGGIQKHSTKITGGTYTSMVSANSLDIDGATSFTVAVNGGQTSAFGGTFRNVELHVSVQMPRPSGAQAYVVS